MSNGVPRIGNETGRAAYADETWLYSGTEKEVSEQEGETLRKQESAHAQTVNRQSRGLFRMKE